MEKIVVLFYTYENRSILHRYGELLESWPRYIWLVDRLKIASLEASLGGML